MEYQQNIAMDQHSQFLHHELVHLNVHEFQFEWFSPIVLFSGKKFYYDRSTVLNLTEKLWISLDQLFFDYSETKRLNSVAQKIQMHLNLWK